METSLLGLPTVRTASRLMSRKYHISNGLAESKAASGES
jgi:hypothetical protein